MMSVSIGRRAAASALLAAGVMTAGAAMAQNEGYLPRPHADRPLVVRRARPVVVVPAPVRPAGPEVIVTGPLRIASTLVSVPFRIGNAIFPANAPPPANVVGAPIAAAGRIAQVPFEVVAAPFGGLPPY